MVGAGRTGDAFGSGSRAQGGGGGSAGAGGRAVASAGNATGGEGARGGALGIYGKNLALLSARAAKGPIVRPPRLSLALASFRRPPPTADEQPSALLFSGAADMGSSYDMASIAIEVAAQPELEAAPESSLEEAAPAASPDAQHRPEETDAEPAGEAVEDDCVDEDEEVREAAARAAKAAAARKTAELAAKERKVTTGLAAPSSDPRKLIIKEGVIHGEVVAAKTFTLRRV